MVKFGEEAWTIEPNVEPATDAPATLPPVTDGSVDVIAASPAKRRWLFARRRKATRPATE